MPEPFCGTVPEDRLYDPTHEMWVMLMPDQQTRIGATAFGIHLAGRVIMFTGKPRGASVAAGRGLGTIETGKTILAVHSPISVNQLSCNESCEDAPQLINEDPYGKGWLAVGHPSDWAGDRVRLLDAASYIRHIQTIDPDARIEAPPP